MPNLSAKAAAICIYWLSNGKFRGLIPPVAKGIRLSTSKCLFHVFAKSWGQRGAARSGARFVVAAEVTRGHIIRNRVDSLFKSGRNSTRHQVSRCVFRVRFYWGRGGREQNSTQLPHTKSSTKWSVGSMAWWAEKLCCDWHKDGSSPTASATLWRKSNDERQRILAYCYFNRPTDRQTRRSRVTILTHANRRKIAHCTLGKVRHILLFFNWYLGLQ